MQFCVGNSLVALGWDGMSKRYLGRAPGATSPQHLRDIPVSSPRQTNHPIVFCCSFLAVGLLLLLNREGDSKIKNKMNRFEKFSAAFIFVIAIANAVTVFLMCGIGFCSDSM